MANVSENLYSWSNTGSSNQPDSGDSSTVQADLQAIQAGVRGWLAHKGSDIASSSATPLADTEGLFHDITGTTTINSFGTTSAGIWKILKFEGAVPLIHSSNLVLPGAANITTADGDIGMFNSEGSGVWRCFSYTGSLSPKEEVGSWTPSVGGSATYTSQFGTYWRRGRHVFITGGFEINAIGTGSTTVVSGLPFTSLTGTQYAFPVPSFSLFATAVLFVMGLNTGGTTTIAFRSMTQVESTITSSAALFGNGTIIRFSGSYLIA